MVPTHWESVRSKLKWETMVPTHWESVRSKLKCETMVRTHWDMIQDRDLCKNIPTADTESRIRTELKTKQEFESKPRNEANIRKGAQPLHRNKFENKCRQRRRNQCGGNPLVLNIQGLKLMEDKHRGEGCCVNTGSLAYQEIPLGGDNCKTAGARNVNAFGTRQTENTGIRRSTLEPHTTGSVRGFKKCLSVINPSGVMRRETRKRTPSISNESLSRPTNDVSARNMNQMASATLNHATYATTSYTSFSSTKNTQSATTNHTPSSASRRRFCILNKRDTNSLRARISVWSHCLCHKPTLKVLRDAFSRMKRCLFQERCKLEILDFNKHITESKEQRDLLRKERLQERSSKCKPVKYISAIVPECQKILCSLNFANKNHPLTSPNKFRGQYDTGQKPINSKTNATNNPERSPVIGNERNREDSLKFLDCENLQTKAPCQISTNSIELEKVNPCAAIKTQKLNIPEWVPSMPRKDVINLHPSCPSELTGPSSEINPLMDCPRRPQLGRLFPNSDLSAGDGCLLISIKELEVIEQKVREQEVREQEVREQEVKEQEIREQEAKEQEVREQEVREQEVREQEVREQGVKLHSEVSKLRFTNAHTKHSTSHCRKSRQEQAVFFKATQNVPRGPGVSLWLNDEDFANASSGSEGSLSQESCTNYLEFSADSLLDNDITCYENNKNLRDNAYPRNINKKEDSNIVGTEQGTMVDTMNKSNSSVHGVQEVLESSQAIVVDDIVDSRDLCMPSNGESELGRAVSTRLHPDTEVSLDGDVCDADHITEPQILCTTIDEPHIPSMAVHTESELNPVIMVQSDKCIPANVVIETGDVETSVGRQEIDVTCGMGSTLEPAPKIHLNENIKSQIGNEVILMENVVRVQEHSTGTNSEQKSLIELCKNLESDTITKVNEIKHLDYKHTNNFNLVTELNSAQFKHENNACLSSFCFDSKHCFPKSSSAVDRKTTDTYLNNSAKISESESPVQDITSRGKKSSENDHVSILPNLPVHELTDHRSTCVHEKTNQAREKNEPTYATSSNSASKSSRDSLIDFIKQKWRDCQASLADPITCEQQADLLKNSHFSSCDTLQLSSSTSCYGTKPFFHGDDEGQREAKSLHKEQSYETMCSDRRENYLKICRALENYYKSSSHENSNSSLSTSATDPQTRQNGSVKSGNELLQSDTTDEMSSRSEMQIFKNRYMTRSDAKSLQPDYQIVNSFLESTRKFLNADVKRESFPKTKDSKTIKLSGINADVKRESFPQTTDIKTRKLSEIKTVPVTMSSLHDSGANDRALSQVNQLPSSSCAETTDSVLLNATDSLSSKLDIPNSESESLTNRIKSSQSIVTNKSCKLLSLLKALDNLLEEYFGSIEELQSRLENCQIRASKYDQSKKSSQKREKCLQNGKNQRQKEQISDSDLNLFESLNYDCLNLVPTEDSSLTRLENHEREKSLAWNCSVNNKQDSPPDSVSTDIDLIDTPLKNKRQNGGANTVSSKEPPLDAAINPESHVAVGNEPKLQPGGSLESPEDNMPQFPVVDNMASPPEKTPTYKKGSGKTSQQQTSQVKPARMQGFQSKQAGAGSTTLPRLSSRLLITPGYPETQQGSSDSPSSRHRTQTAGSDRASIDYMTRDVATITRENHLTDTHRKVYSSIYDKDINKKPIFSPDESVRRMKTTEKQELYNLITTEQEYVRQPPKSYRPTSPEYADSERTPVSSRKSELHSNGKPTISTEPSRKYYFPGTESRDYSNGWIMPREFQERLDYGGQTTFSPTFNPQPRVRIPDYCLNQPRGFTRQTGRPTTPPPRDRLRNVWEGHDKETKTQGSDLRELSEARAWFRDLCERVNTSSRINGSVCQRPRRTHEENICDRNLRCDARISVTPTVGGPLDDCLTSRQNTTGVQDYRNSPFKEHGSKFRPLEVNNRLLDPSKNYNDIALLQTPPILDLNIHRRPKGISDYMYSQTEAPADNRYAPISGAALENTQLVRQNKRPPKTNMGTQFQFSDPVERHFENERKTPARIEVDSVKECASVCIQTCACLSNPNGTCLCGHISLNETIWPNKTNGPSVLNPVGNTEQNFSVKSVCIQTCDEGRRIDTHAVHKSSGVVKETRSRQCSPIPFKCRNKKCQVGRSVQCKNEYTGVGPSLLNDLPSKTQSTHCHRYDRTTDPNIVTTRTKCVQTCSFSEMKNNKRASRKENNICCKCKQKFDDVLIGQLETPDFSSELATDSYENNDKECQCNTLQEYSTPGFDPAAGNESVHPCTKYQRRQPFVHNCICKDGQGSHALASMNSRDVSDDEWEHGKENQPISRCQPSQAERALHQTADSGHACALSHELTEQISGIIRNSRLLQQQAVLLRNKCKYLEGQGWTSINQNRHHGVSACRSHKCSNMVRCHSFKKNPERFMDKNNNSYAEFKRKLGQENGSKYSSQLDCHARSNSGQLTSYQSINQHVLYRTSLSSRHA